VVGFLVAWLTVKIVFVQVVIPARTAKHDPEPIAAELREHVPPGEPLYLFRLKDEGVMFYYARPGVRLNHPGELPPGAYALLIQQEWEDRDAFGHLKVIHWMHDQQGDPLILVRSP
jgi:hypothetical protein